MNEAIVLLLLMSVLVVVGLIADNLDRILASQIGEFAWRLLLALAIRRFYPLTEGYADSGEPIGSFGWRCWDLADRLDYARCDAILALRRLPQRDPSPWRWDS
jgi:hypothetical protein